MGVTPIPPIWNKALSAFSKKRREKEKEKKGKDLRKKREEGIRAGTRAGHFPSFFSLFYNAKNPFFSKIAGKL